MWINLLDCVSFAFSFYLKTLRLDMDNFSYDRKKTEIWDQLCDTPLEMIKTTQL